MLHDVQRERGEMRIAGCGVWCEAMRWLFMQSDLMMRELLSALSELFVRSLLVFYRRKP